MAKYTFLALTNPVEGKEDEFNQWYNTTAGVNIEFHKQLALTESATSSGVFGYDSSAFFPLDPTEGFGITPKANPLGMNFLFTTEIHVMFTIDAPPVEHAAIVHAAEASEDADEAVTALVGGKSLWTARVSKESRVKHGGPLELAVDTRYLQFFDPASGKSWTRSIACALDRPFTRIGASITFSSAVMCGNRLNCWKTMPISARFAHISRSRSS